MTPPIRRFLFVLLTTSGLVHSQRVALPLPPAPASTAAVVKAGVQTVFSLRDLLDNHVVKIVASTNYQIFITFPREVQSVGVNAGKQNALMPTIDKFDGKVLYLDGLRAGGQANLNVRLKPRASDLRGSGPDFATSPEPVILKFIVSLSGQESGVLAYAVQSSEIPAQVLSPVVGVPAKGAAVPAPKRPVPAAASVSAPTGKINPATRTVKTPVPSKSGVALKVPALSAALSQIGAVKPSPIKVSPGQASPIKANPIKAVPIKAASAPRERTGENHGFVVKARVVGSDGPLATVDYRITQTRAVDNAVYAFSSLNVEYRLKNERVDGLRYPAPSSAGVIAGSREFRSQVSVPSWTLKSPLPQILLFKLRGSDRATGLPAVVYLAVGLK